MIMETFEIFKNLCLPHFWTSMWYVVVSLKISKLSKSMEIAEKMSWGMVSMYHLCYYHALKWFYDLAVKSLSWQAHWDEIIFEVTFLLQLGTIPILRQQKNWVGGSRKWPVLLTFSTVFVLLIRLVDEVQKGQKYGDVI